MAFFAVMRRARTLLAAGAIARSFQVQRSAPVFSQFLRSLLPLENFESRVSLSFSFANLSSVASKPASDADLLRVIDVEIKCAEECDDHDRVEEIPEGFPFEIQDRMGLNTITLKRKYHGENIEVLVFMPSLVTGDEPETNRKVIDDEEDETRERPSQSSIPLTVNVSKHGGHGLEFCCTVYPDELVIDSMSFKENSESSEEMLAYEGPDFSDLDENLQKSFYKYLELRGISVMTANILHEYMINKDSREYLLWLRNLKKLIQK